MTAKNRMITGSAIMAIAGLMAGWLVRPWNSASAGQTPLERTESFLSRWSGPRAEVLTVPVGAHLRIRLERGISTERNLAGDLFFASLDEPLTVDGKLLAPRGSLVTGLLTGVTEPGNMQDGASLTLVLRQIQVAGRQYDLVTQPLTLSAQSSENKNAGKIAASATVGVRRAGYVLAGKGEPVAYGPDTQFIFSLADDVDLPVYHP